MTQSFDPYHQWLGIPPAEQPPDNYRLLGLRRFEDDPDAIEQAADRLMGYVRSFQTGKRGQYTQQILNELAAAKLCLLDDKTRQTYDAVLHGQSAMRSPAVTAPPMPAPAPLAEPPAAALTAAVAVSPPPPLVPTSQFSTSPVHSEAASSALYLQPWFAAAAIGGVLLIAAMIGGAALVAAKTAPPTSTDDALTSTAVDLPVAEPPAPLPTSRPIVTIKQETGGDLYFTATTAQINGDSAKLETQGDKSLITNLKSTGDTLTWNFHIEKPGPFRVEATYAAAVESENGTFELATETQQTKPIRVRNTGGNHIFTTERVGFLFIKRSGNHQLHLRPLTTQGSAPLMLFESLRLVPVR